jgi:4-hydroxybenzoate polyprenyltransferase
MESTSSAVPGGGEAGIALAIDLDGSLLKTDLLLESTLALLSSQPWLLAWLPVWLLGGKARLKREIASRVELDVASLPYDARVLALAHAAAGRREVVLCTASDELLATKVAQHLGGFDAVLASDGARNLAGHAKRELLAERYGERGFDYVGNAAVDLRVWRHARHAIVVNAPAALAAAAARLTTVAAHLPAERGGLRAWLRALRLHQWLKNLLVFVPLLAAHRIGEPRALAAVALGFVVFGLCASGTYLLNDLLDLASDRQHPRKRHRPFASGRLSLLQGMLAAPLLVLAAFALAALLSPWFCAALALYLVLTVAYSLRLKQRAMVDVMVLAGLYTLRIIAGAVLLATKPSFWLLAFSVFLFLSLAMLKRYAELLVVLGEGRSNTHGRGYRVDDLGLVQALGTASGYQAVLVLALYINSTASELLYRRPEWLWLLCPILLYWISRAWMIAHRGLMRDDPVVFAATDRVSLVLALACAGIALLATVSP